MIVAFVTLGFRPFRTAGFDLAGERLVDALLAAGHQVRLIAGKSGDLTETETHPNLKIYRIRLGKTDWFGFAFRAARLLKDIGPVDVVHFYDVSFSYAYRGAYVASLHHSFRQRLESLGGFELRQGLRWLYYFLYYHVAMALAERPGFKRAQGLMAVSAATLAEYANHYPTPKAPIRLVHNGIDTDFFCPQPAEKLARLRQSLGIEPGEPVALFAGFITPRKGLEYLARAMRRISPTPRLVIVGKWRSQAYRQEALGLLGPLRSRVIEAGFAPDEEMPAYYSLADVYVSTSLMEGFGLPVGEALACGTPVVAFDAGAVAEVMGPGGVLIPPRDERALAEAISALLQDPQRRQAMSAAGRAHVAQQFSIAAMLRATLEAYREFLG